MTSHDVCHLPCSASCSVIIGDYIGRCISAVHIRRCSAGIRQQCLVAEWLGLGFSVTVRVTARARARAREWNPSLFFSLSVNVVNIIRCALRACIVDVHTSV